MTVVDLLLTTSDRNQYANDVGYSFVDISNISINNDSVGNNRNIVGTSAATMNLRLVDENDLPNCSQLSDTFYDQPTFSEQIGYGFVYPLLAAIVLYLNTHGIACLIRIGSFTPTNTLIMAIFAVDLVTVMFPLPRFLHDFTFQINDSNFLSKYPWCFISNLTSYSIPAISNNISIWLVALLSIQRSICVNQSTSHSHTRLFSTTRLKLAISIIVIATFVFHLFLISSRIVRLPKQCLVEVTNLTLTVCGDSLMDGLIANQVLPAYYISRLFAFHIFPLIAISVSTVILVQSVRSFIKHRHISLQVQWHRKRADSDPHRHSTLTTTTTSSTARTHSFSRRQQFLRKLRSHSENGSIGDKTKHIARTTNMLIVISIVYLLQHTLQTIWIIVGIIFARNNTFQSLIKTWSMLLNLFYTICFPSVFIVCFYAQQQFRVAFFSIYCKISDDEIFRHSELDFGVKVAQTVPLHVDNEG